MFYYYLYFWGIGYIFCSSDDSFNSLLNVVANQWFWQNIDQDINLSKSLMIGDVVTIDTECSLVVPVGSTISSVWTSNDVIHCVSIPSLGLKADLIPGRITHLTLMSNVLVLCLVNVLSYAVLYMDLCL